MSEGELMVEATSEATFGSLSDFLDSLPTQPCPTYPQNRYYCSVCERLNKSTARRCQYSKLKGTKDESLVGGEGTGVGTAQEDTIKFVPMGDETEESPAQTSKTDITDEKVAFKIVTPEKTDKDYPLFEFVQPKDKKIEPIEMELLEDVAIEFDTSDEEAVEVEALEVEPMDDLGDDEEYDDITEVEVMEVDEVDDDAVEFSDVENLPEFKPISEPPERIEKVSEGPKHKKAKVAKKPVKKLAPKSVMKKPVKLMKKAKKTPKSIPSQQPQSVQPQMPSSTQAAQPTLKQPVARQPVQSPQLARPAQPAQTTQPTQPGVRSPSRDNFSQPTLAQPTFQPVGQPPDRLQPINVTQPGSSGSNVRKKVVKKVTKKKKVPKRKL